METSMKGSSYFIFPLINGTLKYDCFNSWIVTASFANNQQRDILSTKFSTKVNNSLDIQTSEKTEEQITNKHTLKKHFYVEKI